jgi:hypothetical protein
MESLALKRENYLGRHLHREAHGVATSMSIVLAWLKKQSRAPNLHSGFAPLTELKD